MHKFEIHVVYISPNKFSGPGLTCGSWKTEVVHVYYFYFSEMAVPLGGCLKQTGNGFGLFCATDCDQDSSGAGRPSVEARQC